jgi:predicted transcriptional regulator
LEERGDKKINDRTKDDGISFPKQLKHRSRSEIIASILEVTNGNRVRRTEIQYKTYLSYNLLTEYLLHLLQCDLLEYIEGERAFKTTSEFSYFLLSHLQPE